MHVKITNRYIGNGTGQHVDINHNINPPCLDPELKELMVRARQLAEDFGKWSEFNTDPAVEWRLIGTGLTIEGVKHKSVRPVKESND